MKVIHLIQLFLLVAPLCATCVTTGAAAVSAEEEGEIRLVEEEIFFLNNDEEVRHNDNQQHSLIRVGNSTSCWDYDDCYECTEAARCHWCKHDNRCHVIGSMYGCLTGMNCDEKPDDDDNDDDDKKKPEKDHCSAYTTCSECGSYRTCHWCAHDESCHAKGSVYGCIRGVDCYSNDRCRRKEAEQLPPREDHFTNMDSYPLLLVISVGTAAFLLVSFCLCCACSAKGAYNDLCLTASAGNNNVMNSEISSGGGATEESAAATTTAAATNSTRRRRNRRQRNTTRAPTANSNLTAALLSDRPDTTSAEETDNHNNAISLEHSSTDARKTNNNTTAETGDPPSSPQQDTIEEGTGDRETFYQAMEEESVNQDNEQTTTPEESAPLLPPSSSSTRATSRQRRRPASKHVQRMMNVCTGLYIISVLAIGGLMFAAIRLFPKVPEYSVCNDSIAWKKLVDSMASLSVEVDFEILMSVSNENHMDVALDMGRGIFKHDGATVGRFTIPPVQAPSMAITDVMIIATVAPEKWEAMSLTKDYYAGKLVLDVDVELNVRVPSLLNFSKEVSIQDRKVYINQEADRHLCHCKKWDGSDDTPNYNRSLGLLELGDFDTVDFDDIDFDFETASTNNDIRI